MEEREKGKKPKNSTTVQPATPNLKGILTIQVLVVMSEVQQDEVRYHLELLVALVIQFSRVCSQDPGGELSH